MSEAKPNLPSDAPLDLAVRPKAINIRKALAGLYMLNGEGSMGRCLTKAGYSKATARIQLRNGLSGEQCVAEAAKLDAVANPANLLAAGRSRAFLAIESVDPRTVRLGDAMKMLDTVEKFYGGHQIQPTNALFTVADRLGQVAALLAVAQSRGLPVPRAPEPFVEAEVVATGAETKEADASVNSLTIDGTTR